MKGNDAKTSMGVQANEIAFKWFEIHADQRLKMMNFFLVIAGFCLAGYFTALQLQNNVAGSVVAGTLVVVAYFFKQLDRRTAQLLELGEDHLKVSLREFSEKLNDPTIDILNLAEQKSGVWSYREAFNALFVVFGVLGAIGVIYPWICSR